jgi:glyoxylase-like metal-dependent hydrolase (beta-lactamase superfamily II)
VEPVCHRRRLLGIAALMACAAGLTGGAQSVVSPRLYVLDGGVLESDPTRYRLTAADVATTQLSVAAYLIVHPRGTLMWDTGAIQDDSWTPTGTPVARHLVLSNGQERRVTLRAPLRMQLSAAGYSPQAITYLAFSHYHWDHVANANAFAGATWLVRQVERDAMFPQTSAPPQPSTYAALAKSRTILITSPDHDVFGDGAVVVKAAPGHTPGHQVLYVRLANTGGVVLSGDLYHYPEERTLKRLPLGDDQEQTQRSRDVLDGFLARSRAQLWIQHDLTAHRKMKMAPAYYD